MSKTFRMTLSAMLIAIVFLFGMTPVGLIPLGFINVTTLCVPVVAGTMLLGLPTGLLLGGCFGLASLMSAFGLTLSPPSALASALMTVSPLSVCLMCIVPRLLVPIVTWYSFRWASRKREKAISAVPVGAVLGSLTNTFGYLGLMLLFYFLAGLDSAKILTLIAGTGLVAGGCEAVAAGILSTSVLAALWKIKK